ncbi:hypothetical protein [Sutcliffiella horikoshii]|uniref:hypothetical protein n=1 Tax=Sutcliffiella horikoshii TaxID=79883 RepID=UPI00384A6BC4
MWVKVPVPVTLLIVLYLLTSCSSTENYVYWTGKTDNQIQRLDQAKINDEIRHGDI